MTFTPHEEFSYVIQSFLDQNRIPENKAKSIFRLDIIASENLSVMEEVKTRVFSSFRRFKLYVCSNNLQIRNILQNKTSLDLLNLQNSPRVKFACYPGVSILYNKETETHIQPNIQHYTEVSNCHRGCCVMEVDGNLFERDLAGKLALGLQSLITQGQVVLLTRPYTGAPPSRKYGLSLPTSEYTNNSEIRGPDGRLREGTTRVGLSGDITGYRDFSESIMTQMSNMSISTNLFSHRRAPTIPRTPENIDMDMTNVQQTGDSDLDDPDYIPGDNLSDEDFFDSTRISRVSARTLVEGDIPQRLDTEPDEAEIPVTIPTISQPQSTLPPSNERQTETAHSLNPLDTGMTVNDNPRRSVITVAAETLISGANSRRNTAINGDGAQSQGGLLTSGGNSSRPHNDSAGSGLAGSRLRVDPASSISGARRFVRPIEPNRPAVMQFGGQPIVNPIYGPPRFHPPGVSLNEPEAPPVNRTVSFSGIPQSGTGSSNGLVSEMSGIIQGDGNVTAEGLGSEENRTIIPGPGERAEQVTHITADLLYLLNGAGSFPETFYKNVDINVYISTTSVIVEVIPIDHMSGDEEIVRLNNERIDLNSDSGENFFNNDIVEDNVFDCIQQISEASRAALFQRFSNNVRHKVIIRDIKHLENTDALELRYYPDRFILKGEKDSSLLEGLMYLDETSGTGYLFNDQDNDKIKSWMGQHRVNEPRLVPLTTILVKIAKIISLFGGSTAESDDQIRRLSHRAFDHRITKRTVTIHHPDAVDQIGDRGQVVENEQPDPDNSDRPDGDPHDSQEDGELFYDDFNNSGRPTLDRRDLGLTDPPNLPPMTLNRRRGRGSGLTSDGAGYSLFNTPLAYVAPLLNSAIYRFVATTSTPGTPPEAPAETEDSGGNGSRPGATGETATGSDNFDQVAE